MNIIAQLQGGLGNQLFQYATARALALENNASLLLDCGWYKRTYEDVSPRELLINQLKTTGRSISLDQALRKPKRFRRIFQSIWPVSPFIFFEKSAYKFDKEIFNVPPFVQQTLYLMGYWQSYKYFEAIKSILTSELTPLKPLLPHYQTYLKKIQGTQSAMLHIRRGDYITIKNANEIHGTLNLDFYIRGMNILLKRNPETHFFVFSDDLFWAKKHLPNLGPLTYIESSDSVSAVISELELMKNCKSHLIANSSLSWWGAWLSYSEDSFVVCPKHWTRDLSMEWDDLIPANWLRI